MDEVVRMAKAAHPQAAVVVLSGNENPDYIRYCISQTASNYLVKGKDDTNKVTFVSSIKLAINEMRARSMLNDMAKKAA
jgi:DNA-binding NarL/FixJ family response regulator